MRPPRRWLPRATSAARRRSCAPTAARFPTSTQSSIAAADCPVVDTSCAALWSLAGEVHRQGYKVALTGEGADEALAGYVWFKTNKMQRLLDIGGYTPSAHRQPPVPPSDEPRPKSSASCDRIDNMIGGPHAQSEMYSMVSNSRSLFFSAGMKEALGRHVAYEDLPLNLERMRRWHPLNQSLYLGYKTLLPGLLLNHKGDRVAMANSVETRYPFLDEDLIALCARVHPRFKLKGLRQDKYLLRQAAARLLPAEIALRPKAMFRAPFAATFLDNPPAYVHQLMSEESLTPHRLFRRRRRAEPFHRSRPRQRGQAPVLRRHGPRDRARNAALASSLFGWRIVRIAGPRFHAATKPGPRGRVAAASKNDRPAVHASAKRGPTANRLRTAYPQLVGGYAALQHFAFIKQNQCVAEFSLIPAYQLWPAKHRQAVRSMTNWRRSLFPPNLLLRTCC